MWNQKGSIERIIKQHVNGKNAMESFDAAHPSNDEWLLIHFGILRLWVRKKRANRKPCDKMLVSVCCTINAFNLSEFIHRTPLDLHKCLSHFFFCVLRQFFLCRLGIHHELLICHLTRVWNGEKKMNIWFVINWIMSVGLAMLKFVFMFAAFDFDVEFLMKFKFHCWDFLAFVVQNPIILSIDPSVF